MATPEALTKYYDCLRDSFNKIQVKDNTDALVNAALRPKIREEFAKSKNLLISYLNYLKVFTLIYSDKFGTICINIICPLFREHAFKSSRLNDRSLDSNSQATDGEDTALLVHETIRVILKSKPELIDDLIQSVIRLFPAADTDGSDVFLAYLSNALQVCTYIRGEPLTNLMAKILDRINPRKLNQLKRDERAQSLQHTVETSHDLLYERLDEVSDKQLEDISAAILAAFTREFLTSENPTEMNHLILYVCSKKNELADLFINLLWANFTDPEKSISERRASVLHASSFMARATYVELDKVFNLLDTASIWCHSFLKNDPVSEHNGMNNSSEIFYSLVESMLYLITQRYREMYEEESLAKLKNLNFETLLGGQSKALEHCNLQTVRRFSEVSSLYNICPSLVEYEHRAKRRKSTSELAKQYLELRLPFEEAPDKLPSRISSLYRRYYDHRNFTIYRE